MKKNVSLLLSLVLCFSMLLTLASCSFKHPIEQFFDKMTKANNFQMSVTMSDIPFIGTMTIMRQKDGNITYSPTVLFGSATYTETVGDVTYTYTENEDGTWTKTQSENDDSSDVVGDNEMAELFNPDNFEKVKDEKNTYKQKSDVKFDTMEDVVIVITDDECTITLNFINEGLVCPTKVVISKIGEIELTLPTVD